jgi:hypothetical protein
VKTSTIKISFAFSPQNVSNATETNFPANARNENQTPLNVKTVTNNIRATSQDKHSNVNKQNAPCLIENNFLNLHSLPQALTGKPPGNYIRPHETLGKSINIPHKKPQKQLKLSL